MLKRDRQRFYKVYERLMQRYGAQHWWPADSPFEVMVGAILTLMGHFEKDLELFESLAEVRADSVSGEYYVTDVPSLLLSSGRVVEVIDAVPPEDVLSINTPDQLAEATRCVHPLRPRHSRPCSSSWGRWARRPRPRTSPPPMRPAGR